jgi:Flp pilus assembly protein TadD
MRSQSEAVRPRQIRWRMLAVVAASLAAACTTSGSTRPPAIAVRDASGFTITEKVRVSADVREKFTRAIGLLEQQQIESGIALLDEVTQAAPDLTAAHIDLGIARARAGDLERAEASLERALELDPRHPVAHNELGILYRRMGRFAEARASYEKALALYPEFHFARRNLAVLCDLYLADVSCALEHYGVYIQAVPDDEDAAIWIADLRSRAGQ